jgi:hypothetical protein
MPPDLKLVHSVSKQAETQLWDAINRIAEFAQGNSLQLELLVRRQRYVLLAIGTMIVTNVLNLVF